MTPAFDTAAAAILAQEDGWQNVVVAQWNCTLPYERPLLNILARGSFSVEATSKNTVLAASTANMNLGEIVWGSTVIDGITITAAGQRFLAKSQTSPEQNGIYVSSDSGLPAVRADDCDTWDKLVNSTVVVKSGTVNAATHWLCTVAAGGTLGTTAVTYTTIS